MIAQLGSRGAKLTVISCSTPQPCLSPILRNGKNGGNARALPRMRVKRISRTIKKDCKIGRINSHSYRRPNILIPLHPRAKVKGVSTHLWPVKFGADRIFHGSVIGNPGAKHQRANNEDFVEMRSPLTCVTTLYTQMIRQWRNLWSCFSVLEIGPVEIPIR